MPLFHWCRDEETGYTYMKRVEDVDFTKQQAVVTDEVDLPRGEDKITVFQCDVSPCPKSFPNAALYAVHFKKDHSPLYKDKDSWREYYTKRIL